MHTFVLFLVGQHDRFFAQLVRALVGQQRIIATSGKGLVKSVLTEGNLGGKIYNVHDFAFH